MQIPLKHPVTVDGKTYSALTLRRAKGKDMVHLERLSKAVESEVDIWPAQLDLIASLSDSSRNLMNEINSSDLGNIMEAVNGFLSGSQPDTSPAGASS